MTPALPLLAALPDPLPEDGPVLMALAQTPAPLPGETPFWFLQGQAKGGAGLLGAWALALGRGVQIGVLDSGINAAHSDFLPGQCGGSSGAQQLSISNPHGTRVAGLIAGRLDNAIGGLGGATGAEVLATTLDFSLPLSPVATASALAQQAGTVDVSNNSWGWSRALGDNFRLAAFQPVQQALVAGATEGREGLGTVWVFAAGNGRLMKSGQNHGDDSNFHNLTNARQTIAVGATDASGKVASFSSPGTNLLLVAPGQGLATTDGLEAGAAGRILASGTSFSAPLVGSTVAMMLEVNPLLGYRDVQHILAITARPIASAPGSANAGTAVNGGGLAHSRDAGFGLLDAEAAVRLARHYQAGGTAATETSVSASLTASDTDPDPAIVRLTFQISPGPAGLSVEWAELGLTLSDPALRSLSVELISPAGTRALIAPNFSILGNATTLNFGFSSAATWGEAAEGEWSVILSHADGTTSLAVLAADLALHGRAGGDDGQRWFTDAWAGLAAADPGRSVIGHQAAGPGILNFAAVQGAVTLDLGLGTGTLGGRGFALTSAFNRVVGGAGNDRLTGATGAETLTGDDGHDQLTGKAGDDRLDGGTGHDILTGGLGNDILIGGSGNDTLVAGAGADTLIGGPGSDVMTGGAGADLFVFAPGDANGTLRPDRIKDFVPGEDFIQFSDASFIPNFIGNLKFSGIAGEFRYVAKTRTLSFDLDGDMTSDVVIDVRATQDFDFADLFAPAESF